MNEIVKEAVASVYNHTDRVHYLEKCQLDLNFIDTDIKNLFISDEKPIISDCSNQKIWPSKEWLFDFSEFVENGFKASFTTILKVSKIASLFYVQHEFSVLNKVVEKIEPTLDGYSGMPYIMAQYDLHENLSRILKEKNFVELRYSEIYEVLPNLRFPEDVTIFGPQVTVEYALFHDLLDLCPNDDEQ
jgi:hypothetical protein